MLKKEAVLVILTRYNEIKAEKKEYIEHGALYNFAEGKMLSLKWVLRNVYGIKYYDKRF